MNAQDSSANILSISPSRSRQPSSTMENFVLNLFSDQLSKAILNFNDAKMKINANFMAGKVSSLSLLAVYMRCVSALVSPSDQSSASQPSARAP